MNASTAPVCAPVTRPVMKPACRRSRRRRSSPAWIAVAARTHSARSMMRASATSAPSLSPVTSRTGISARMRGASASCSIAWRGCSRWPPARAGRAWRRRWRRIPSRRCGRRSALRAGLTSCTRTTAASRRTRRSRCARSAPRRWTCSANVSTRPLAVGDDADQRVGARQRSGLGPQPARRRAAGVGVEEAVRQRAAAACDGQQVHQRPQRRAVGAPPRR